MQVWSSESRVEIQIEMRDNGAGVGRKEQAGRMCMSWRGLAGSKRGSQRVEVVSEGVMLC